MEHEMNRGEIDVNLRNYYSRRASEYEKIYAKPERQAELASLRSNLSNRFAGLDVLEIACGTGYWTQVISESATSIVATDINEEVLAIARHKNYAGTKPAFQIADAYALNGLDRAFTAGFAGFWWSHLPKPRVPAFLERFQSRLTAGAIVVFLDNKYVEGSSTPIARRDGDGNTYQKRKLDDGTEHEVLKNFPTEAELRTCVGGLTEDIVVTQFKYYWCLSYRISTTPRSPPGGALVCAGP